MKTYGDLFTPRQLVALTTFADLVGEAIACVRRDAQDAGLPDDGVGLNDGGTGATAYAQAVGVYLAFGVSRLANRLATLCMWNRIGETIEQVFARQAIPMIWDFAEANALSDSTGGWTGSLEWIPIVLETFRITTHGCASQSDAAVQSVREGKIISTDPPYYDNIGYADLSDFFYVWLRRSLRPVFPDLFATLAELQRANIAPVDLAQAAIGPGMAVYTRYARVLDAEGRPVSVREALELINATLDEALAEQEGDFDADTRWAIAWFEQHGFGEGEFGVAETLSKAKNTSVAGLAEAGLLESKRGKVRLLKPAEMPVDWNPATDLRLTAWEVVHHLIRALEAGGESGAATLVGKLGAKAETARELAYRLYTLCERKKRAAEALSYNALVQSWPEIVRLARESGTARPAQETLFEDVEA